MEEWVAKQFALASHIDHFIENTNKAGRANFNAGFLRSRSELLERYWDNFRQNHQLLIGERELADSEYITTDRYSLVELAYSRALGMVYDKEARIPRTRQPEQAAAVPAGQPARQVHLPKIALPTFSGHQDDWESFRDMFRSLVHIDPGLTGVQKLHYLKTCVGGPAADTLMSLEITKTNYNIAWDLLRARFDDRQLLIQQHMNALATISPLTSETSAGLQRLHDLISRRREALRMLEQPVVEWDQWFVFFAAKGMDASTRREWEKELGKPSGAATFTKLTAFLKDSARTLKTIELSKRDKAHKESRPDSRRRNAPIQSQSRKVLTTGSSEEECPVCNGQHRVSRCEKFESLALSKRVEIVRRARLCFNRLPRWLNTTSSSVFDLHGFADASNEAYAAVVYARISGDPMRCPTRILASKNRVAPIKAQTIPRLELCAATLLAELLHRLRDGLGVRVGTVHAWSDSTVTLAWINTDPSRRDVFVANRVSKIQRLLPGTIWRHVSSEDNSADLASRGLCTAKLAISEIWWRGPSWLTKPPPAWPMTLADPVPVCTVQPEDLANDVHAPPSRGSDFMERFSSLEHLLRTTATCLRFRLLTRPGWKELLKRPMTVTELNKAFHACVRNVQDVCFREEVSVLRRGHALGRRCGLSSLKPFLDADGLMRVGGRLPHAQLPYDQRHPVILPKKSHLGRLVIDRAHRTAMHGGHALTYSYAMRSAWIVGGRAQTRAFVRQCVTCVRARARPATQLMGSLPSARVVSARPFSRTGLDYAGPFSIKASTGRGGRKAKGYLAAFVCMCTKAVHLELVGDLTTASFLGALHRFTARKTAPREIWSDNATTFHGADAELRAMFREAKLDWGRVSDDLAASGISWNFIPPAAPHFGGLWEAAVKSAKALLKKIVGQRTLTYEEMSTLIARVESCLNSRPLTPLSGEIDDLRVLTPWHLVSGFPPISIPDQELDLTERLDHMTHWRLIRGLRDQFWMRWSREYLYTLQRRAKWQQPQLNLKVGDLVLIIDASLLRQGRWPLGRITAVHPGADGKVRVATIRTCGGEYDRPITKLCRLPVEDQSLSI